MVTVAIVGATASGKSDLAMAVAATVPDVEIVAVDAMQVYRGMDIGTAKPTAAEQQAVRHHGIDLVDPSDPWTVAEHQRAARAAVVDIQARGGRPLLVAGTGLYLSGLIDDLEIPGTWPTIRAELEATSSEPGGLAALHGQLVTLDPVAASRMEATNVRRVVRALEVCVGSGRPFSSFGPGMDAYPASDVVQIGLRWPRPLLAARIEARVHRMMAGGLLAEVASLVAADRPPLSRTARQALGYRELIDHLRGGVSLDDAVATIVVRTRQFAARQDRWFRRDPRIRWVDIETDSRHAEPAVREALGAMTTARITKHHGLGNDFLVWIDGDVSRGPELAVRWCDRRRGIGADGLLIAPPATNGEPAHTDGEPAHAGAAPGEPTTHRRMVLFNADGSRAEMSGNGIRCFVQAIGAGRPGRYVVDTDAGPRTVDAVTTDDARTMRASVDMGEVRAGQPSATWASVGCHPDRPVAHLDLGNPHTVIGVDDLDVVDLARLGDQVPDVNIEVIAAGPEPDAITMRVHERGAGITEACGTGACASVWAAAQWGLVSSTAEAVVVHMDGGDATVRLNEPAVGRVTLVGPAALVATLEVEA